MEKTDEEYIVGLFPAVGKIKDENLRRKVILTWYKAWKRSNFARIEEVHQFEPAWGRIAYTNVDHTNQVCRASEKMAGILGEVLNLRVNMDFLLAGAVLHDVDKMVIFDAKTGGFTETGRRFAHGAMGAALALVEGIPEEVAHIIGAHSSRFSPLPPASVESFILRHADELVAQGVYSARGLEVAQVMKQSLASIA
jgi:putative nucleotidyltransferase with HDIG domain